MSKDDKKPKKKSRASTYLSIGTTLFGAVGVVRRLKDARLEGDTLRLADAVVSAASIVTSVALLVRDIRRMNEDEPEAIETDAT